MSEQQIVPAGRLDRSAAEVPLWSTYIWRRSDTGAVIYAGRSRQPENRLKFHLRDARSPANRHRQVVSGIVYELSEQGIGVTLEIVAEGLSPMAAKTAEGLLIQNLLQSGAPLANTRQLDGGKGGVVIRSTPGSAERLAEKRAYCRDRRVADPDYRNRHLAKGALWDLNQGAGVTPRRVEVVTLVGRASDALAILRSQGRESEWPRDGPMD